MSLQACGLGAAARCAVCDADHIATVGVVAGVDVVLEALHLLQTLAQHRLGLGGGMRAMEGHVK